MTFPLFQQNSYFNTPNVWVGAQDILEAMYLKSPSYPYPFYTQLIDNSFNILAVEIQEIMEYEDRDVNEKGQIITQQIKPHAEIMPVIINTKNLNKNTKTLDINPNYEALGLLSDKEQYDFNWERHMDDLGYQTFNVDTRRKKYLYAFVLDNQLVEIKGNHLEIEKNLASLHTLVEQDWLKSKIKSTNAKALTASPVKHKI